MWRDSDWVTICECRPGRACSCERKTLKVFLADAERRGLDPAIAGIYAHEMLDQLRDIVAGDGNHRDLRIRLLALMLKNSVDMRTLDIRERKVAALESRTRRPSSAEVVMRAIEQNEDRKVQTEES